MCATIANESSPAAWIVTIVLGAACIASYWYFIGRRAYGLADRVFRNTEWMVEYRCVACDHVLDGTERCLRHGVCPYCGHDSRWAYCATRKVIYRYKDGKREEKERPDDP